jgi:hypothetical protein
MATNPRVSLIVSNVGGVEAGGDVDVRMARTLMKKRMVPEILKIKRKARIRKTMAKTMMTMARIHLIQMGLLIVAVAAAELGAKA